MLHAESSGIRVPSGAEHYHYSSILSQPALIKTHLSASPFFFRMEIVDKQKFMTQGVCNQKKPGKPTGGNTKENIDLWPEWRVIFLVQMTHWYCVSGKLRND